MAAAVVFDLGMLSQAQGPAELARRLGVGVAQLLREYEKGRASWEAGGPAADYWGPLLERLGVEPTQALISGLVRLDLSLGATLRPSAWQLLRDCQTAGLSVVVLSNNPAEMTQIAQRTPWHEHIDRLYLSGSLGLRKPDPTIYQLVADELGEQLWCIDDQQPSIDAARAAGWRAHLWVDDVKSRAWLISEGLLPQ